MNRVEILQYLLNKIGGKTYLEIGVYYGASFCPVIAQRKIAVDPIPATPRVREHLLCHLRAAHYQVTSDVFLPKRVTFLTARKLMWHLSMAYTHTLSL